MSHLRINKKILQLYAHYLLTETSFVLDGEN